MNEKTNKNEIKKLEEKLRKILTENKNKNKNLVYIDEAVVYYLIGKKVRRYINKEILDLTNEIAKLGNKRIVLNNLWVDNWIWNNKGKKITNNLFEDSLLSPIQSFEKNGYTDLKLWEIESLN